MSTELSIKCSKISKEKSWMSDKKGTPLNRNKIEFSVEWKPSVDDKSSDDNNYEGTTLTLQTMDEREAAKFKLNKKYSISLKPE